MTRQTRAQSAPPSRHDIATEWLLRIERLPLSEVEQAELEAWLAADAGHQAAWRAVKLATALVDQNAGHDSMMALRAAALAAKPETRFRRGWPIAACLALAIASGASWLALGDRVSVAPGSNRASGAGYVATNAGAYATAVGERSTFSLSDGSTVTLDTNSELKVDYRAHERGVRLIRGQALFDVAKHNKAPFRVYAANQTVTAVGTRFNVRVDESGGAKSLHVALIEGVVKVSPRPFVGPPRPSAKDVTLSAGELMEVREGEPIKVAAADTDRLSSWRTGVLAFDDAPLNEAVAEMNRYTTRPIVLTSERLASYRLSGVFRTGDPRRFGETISELFPIEVSDGASGETLLSPR